MKRPEELAINNPLRLRRCRVAIDLHSSSTKSHTICRLERLPPEILEQIFAYSLSPNLAEASPYIGRVMSTERIYRSFMLYAFFEDNYVRLTTQKSRPIAEDDKLYKIMVASSVVDRQAFRPIEYVHLDDDDRLALQRQIMCRRWFTLSRFEAILPKLLEISWRQQIMWEQKLKESNSPIVESIEDLRKDADISNEYFAMEESQRPSPGVRFPVLMESLRPIRRGASLEAREQILALPRRFCWQEDFYCHVRHIPDKLLLPRNHEEELLLAFLIEPTLPWDTFWTIDVNDNVLAKGVRQAVMQSNYFLISTLIYLIEWKLLTSTTPKQLQEELIPSLFPPELYRLAVQKTKSGTSGHDVLRLLCYTDWIVWTIPRNDPILTKFALNDDTGLGAVMLRSMEENHRTQNQLPLRHPLARDAFLNQCLRRHIQVSSSSSVN